MVQDMGTGQVTTEEGGAMTKKVFNEEDRVLPAELPAHEMPGLIPRTDCVGAMELRQQIENSHG